MNKKRTIINYNVHQLTDYIDWIYFFHAWGMGVKFAQVADIHSCEVCLNQWITSFPIEEQAKAREAAELYKEAKIILSELDLVVKTQVLFQLFEANSDGDNLLVGDKTIPLLRQQNRVVDATMPFLCLSDFVRPVSQGISDVVGVFGAAVDPIIDTLNTEDPFKHIITQILGDRLAEAAVERMHEYIRKEAWGYAKEEKLTPKELFGVKYQGIRPAVGYPSLPDQSINFILDKLIEMEQIGLVVSENGAMYPHASVSGLIFAHPQARYFAIGKIGEDQLLDYTARRGLTLERAKQFLAANLPY